MFKKIFEKKILLIMFLFLFIFTAGVHFTNAENQIFLENLPGLDNLANETQKAFKDGGDMNKPLRMYLNWLIQTSVVLGSILAVGLIIAGGVEYMTTGTFTGKSEGKERVTNAVLGFIFLISGYLIFQQINPKILNINLSNAGKIKMEVETGKWVIDGVPFDPDDGGDYDSIRSKLLKKGYIDAYCSSVFREGFNTVDELKKACEEKRKDPEYNKGKKTSICFKWSPAGNLDTGSKYCFMIKVKDVHNGEREEKGYGEISESFRFENACNKQRLRDKRASNRECFCNSKDDLSDSCFYNRKSKRQILDEWKAYGRKLKSSKFKTVRGAFGMDPTAKDDLDVCEEKRKEDVNSTGKCIVKFSNGLYVYGYFLKN